MLHVSLNGELNAWTKVQLQPLDRAENTADRVLADGLEPVTSRVADAFTKVALDASNDTVWVTSRWFEVNFSVDRPWLILPGGLVALGAVFLGLAIFVNHRQKFRPWRTSLISVLFHGLHGLETETVHTAIEAAGQMEQVAQNIHVLIARRGALDRSG
jgi:hypothetical protein